MQTNETPAGSVPDVDLADESVDERVRVRRYRSREGENRSQRLNPRFTPDELVEVAAAATSVGMTPTGFCADSALAAARGTPRVLEDAQYREELARLLRQLLDARTRVVRFGTNVNQAVAQMNSGGGAPDWLRGAVRRAVESVEQLDAVIAEVDRRLR